MKDFVTGTSKFTLSATLLPRLTDCPVATSRILPRYDYTPGSFDDFLDPAGTRSGDEVESSEKASKRSHSRTSSSLEVGVGSSLLYIPVVNRSLSQVVHRFRKTLSRLHAILYRIQTIARTRYYPSKRSL